MKDTSITIRPVEESDRDKLIALLGKVYFGSDTLSDPEDRKLVHERADEQIKNSIDNHSGKKLFLAIADDKPISLAYVIHDNRRGGYLVDDLHTLKEYEGKGIASALLKNCENFVKARGDTDIHLSVDINNEPAIDFYSKRGWLKQNFYDAGHGQQSTDIDPLNTKVATHIMRKTL